LDFLVYKYTIWQPCSAIEREELCFEKMSASVFTVVTFFQVLPPVNYFAVLTKERDLGTPWRRGIVVIASAYRTEDPGLESRQGVRFFRN
jgi:hypothetical protein